MNRFLAGLATVALGAGLVIATGVPASATPACVNYGGFEVPGGTAWVPLASGFNTSCHLQRGYANDGVWALQVSMTECYGENLEWDGDFGPATEAALKRTQKKIGVTADGQYGPYTRDRMLHAGTWAGECFRFDGPGGY